MSSKAAAGVAALRGGYNGGSGNGNGKGAGPVAEAKGNSAGRLVGMVQMLNKVKAERVAFAFPEPARHFTHLAGEVEASLGPRLVALFGADPLPPL